MTQLEEAIVIAAGDLQHYDPPETVSAAWHLMYAREFLLDPHPTPKWMCECWYCERKRKPIFGAINAT